jgi:predicted nucleic acid-binding protein
MKLWIDTNIFLDALLKREGFETSLMILNAIEKGIYEGFVADITLLNIDYIASKQIKNITPFLEHLNHVFTVVGADNTAFTKALALQTNDLEDAMQYILCLYAYLRL